MALPVPFDPQGFPIVNAIVQGGGSGGGLTPDAGNSSAVALTGSGGATPTFTGATVDMQNYPAVLVNLYNRYAANTDNRRPMVLLIWSDNATPFVSGSVKNNPYYVQRDADSQGAILVNRIARYLTVRAQNRSVDNMSAMRLSTYLLGESVEEYDSTHDDGPSPALGQINLNDNAEHHLAVDPGRRYRVSVIGTEGACICVDGSLATVNDEPWYDGQKFEFTAHDSTVGVSAIKRTAGTANGVVLIARLDDNNG